MLCVEHRLWFQTVAITRWWISQTSIWNKTDEKNQKRSLLHFASCLSCRPVSQYLFNCFRACSGSTTVTGSTLSRRRRLRPASKCCQTWVRCSCPQHLAIFAVVFNWNGCFFCFSAKSRAIAIPVDLDSQVNNLFVKSNNVVQKSILNWRLSAKNTSRRDSGLTTSKDYRNIIERLQVSQVISGIFPASHNFFK